LNGLRYLRAHNLGSHEWKSIKGPNSAFMYYKCSECNLYTAVARETGAYGRRKVVFSLAKFGGFDRNMITMGFYDVLDDKLCRIKNPKCSDIHGLMMDEALE